MKKNNLKCLLKILGTSMNDVRLISQIFNFDFSYRVFCCNVNTKTVLVFMLKEPYYVFNENYFINTSYSFLLLNYL